MRIYQRIRFRLIFGAVLLVSAGALLPTLYSRQASKKVLRQHAEEALIRETSLVCSLMSAQTQMLSGDVVGLANNSELRRFRWVDLFEQRLYTAHEPKPEEKEQAKPNAKKAIHDLLARRARYLQIEYYRQREKIEEKPILVCRRRGFDSSPNRPLQPDDPMIRRAKSAVDDVCFSEVQVWNNHDDSKRAVVLQACLPVRMADENSPVGLLVVTFDFRPTAEALTRSPRHLVFLAGGDGRLLMYPQPNRAPSYVLGRHEQISEQAERFRKSWLTDETAPWQVGSENRTFPLLSRYSPGSAPAGRGDDDWRPPDLQLLLLRCRVGAKIRDDPDLREGLSATLEELKAKYTNLVIESGIKPTTEEVLIRGFEEDRQNIRQVQAALLEKHALESHLLPCARFIRTLYKFTPGRHEDSRPREGMPESGLNRLPEQCLYIAMAYPIEAIEAKINDSNNSIYLMVFGCVLVAVGLAVVGSFLLTRPLNAITRATQELAVGKSDVRLPITDSTEIGVLARSFDFMVGQVQERQRDVARREARLQTILDSAAEAILTVGEDGTIRSFNKAAEKLFGYTASEIIDHHLSRLIEDPSLADTDAFAAERLAARLDQGKLSESVGRRKDGVVFPLEYGGNRVPLEARTLLTLILRDITWRKEAEEAARRRNEELERHVKERTAELEAANVELALARDKAEQVAVAKDFFLATVSHELRTPLNHVTGYIQLLEITELDEDQRRDLEKIHHAADNLLVLVNDLLDYQKMIQGVLTLEPTTFDLAPWIEDLVEAMRPKVAEKGNKLVVDCPADIGTLEADEKRLRQALTNLLSNAAKFTRDGVVTVSVRRERDGTNDRVRLDVLDTGRGMSLVQQTKLFQPFTKLLSRSDNPEGTGLGLVLSQRLCRLMGGDLLLSHSEIGQGSTFTICLPAPIAGAAPVPPPHPAPEAVATRASQKPLTVLVIDDDLEVQELMRRHLEGQGFVVHLATSGAEGLEMVKRLQPDAITLDVLMPGIDGWGTLAALQADVETANIPVIMITMLDDRTRGFALGAWEVLPKPISWSRLIDLLRHIEPNTGPVLLVDHDPAFRELAGRTLMQHGWEVCGVENGRAALTAAARRRPALVLLDLVMPVMDGFEFLQEFRKDAAWRDVPVVVLTGTDVTAEDRQRLSGQVQRILSKGLSSQEELLREIEWLLHNHTTTAHPQPDAEEDPVENVFRG
jgi:PAS domain S-box-containing protein